MEGEELWALQSQIRAGDLVCRLELEATTPILIGGYDARTSHGDCGREGLRPPSVKGVWRWWARSLVSAALRRRTGRFPDVREADRIVSRVLGAARGRGGPSKYQLVVTDVRIREVSLSNYRNVARIGLLGMGRDRRDALRDRVLGPGSRFRLELYRQRASSRDEDEFAACSLLLALALGGVGKAASRGFGKLAPSVARPSCQGLSNVVKLHSMLWGLRELGPERGEEVEKGVRGALELCVRLAEPLLDPSWSPSHELPLIETPEGGYYDVVVPNRTFERDLEALRVIGCATLKLYWKALSVAPGGARLRDSLSGAWSIHGAGYPTWILGLPRHQEPEENLLTGYWARMGGRAPLRRRSPVVFVPVRRSDGRYYVVVLGFRTYDWERATLEYFSPSLEEPISVLTNPQAVDSTFDQAMKNVKEIIERW